MSDEVLADLLALALAARPDRLQAVALETQPAEVRAAVAGMTETLSALASAEPAAAPSPGLRDRILASLSQDKRRRAIVVVDMLNDHLEPGSVLEVPRARAIVPALAARIDAARAAGVPVVYVVDRHEPDDSDLDDWGVHAVKGTKGAEVWPAVAPKAQDRVVPKPSYSGFFASTLESVLAELKVDTLVLTGCSTEVQLMVTATDAMQKGFDVEVPEDLQAGVSLEAEQGALAILRMLKPYKPAREALLARLDA
jgi:nicotinamidase/pyrazinamidase